MAILFAGGEDIDFTLPPVGVRADTSSSYRRAAYSRYAINPNYYGDAGNGLLGYCYGDFSQPAQSLWFSVRAVFPLNFGSGKDTVSFFSEDGKRRISLRNAGTRRIEIVVYDDYGTATQLAMTDVNVLPSFEHARYDLQIATGSSGRIRFYYNGMMVASFDGAISLGSASSLTKFGFQQLMSGSDSYYSEFIVATVDTRLMEIRTHTLTGPGTHNDWTGDASLISENLAAGSNFLRANTTNAVSTFAVSDRPSTGFDVVAVVASARLARGENGPTNASLVVRTNATTLEANTVAVDGGWQRTNKIWDKNPATNNVWTAAELDAIEVGIKTKP